MEHFNANYSAESKDKKYNTSIDYPKHNECFLYGGLTNEKENKS